MAAIPLGQPVDVRRQRQGDGYLLGANPQRTKTQQARLDKQQVKKEFVVQKHARRRCRAGTPAKNVVMFACAIHIDSLVYATFARLQEKCLKCERPSKTARKSASHGFSSIFPSAQEIAPFKGLKWNRPISIPPAAGAPVGAGAGRCARILALGRPRTARCAHSRKA